MQYRFPIFLSVQIKKLFYLLYYFKTNIHSFSKTLIKFGLEIFLLINNTINILVLLVGCVCVCVCVCVFISFHRRGFS